MIGYVKYSLIPALAIGLILAIILFTGLGFIPITPAEIIQILTAPLRGETGGEQLQSSHYFVIVEVRLPRILTAVIVGGGLAVAGCVFQSLLQNPLADPYTLGISSGAAFGASLAILLLIVGSPLLSSIMIPLFAFLGALFTSGLCSASPRRPSGCRQTVSSSRELSFPRSSRLVSA